MDAPEKPWHAAYPAPRDTEPEAWSPSQVLSLLQSGDAAAQQGKVVLVDLRRNDHEGGTIRTSINLPAQSLYPSIPTLYSMFAAAGVHTVIWYCMSSRGRGTRAAGWFSDYIADQGNAEMKSVVLQGGIKGWVAAGEEYTAYVDEYDAAHWLK
ncbi:hypothetical protein S40285_04627 [Stachybotrys chlorohalonatus IBT 40285]|uniref:Rhodanese domain-containing protein n=1 Tax=Stachybotrys chlorohalonatus (strain IBT 40285) TaxID=1283841 RepID=A0A084QZR3_STAC4|nr:hypothetical protein S40285_04627 [Stachybotrys chlorohalonata IBT 40285]